MPCNRYQKLEDVPQEEMALEPGDDFAAITAGLKASQRRQHQLLIIQWFLLLIMGMAGIVSFLQGRAIVTAECDSGHVFCMLICSTA